MNGDETNEHRASRIRHSLVQENSNEFSAVSVDAIRQILQENQFCNQLDDRVVVSVIVSILRKDREKDREIARIYRIAYQRGLHDNASTRTQSTGEPLRPPDVCATNASSLNLGSSESRRKKQKYDTEILPQELYENSFVHVKSYFRFVEGCATALAESKLPTDEATSCFGRGAFENWCPVENKTGQKETKRSLALSRAFGKELRSEPSLDVQHQTPIVPNTDKLTQQADICFFLQTNGPSLDKPRIVAELEYKPSTNDWAAYESQACAYGMDIMHIVNSPVIVIQAHGLDLGTLYFRAIGIVPAKMTNDSATLLRTTTAEYRKVLLFEGHGPQAFAAIAAGLRECATGVKQDASFDSFHLPNKVSSVASVLSVQDQDRPKQIFVKSFDYRVRSDTLKENRRHANIDLVRHFIDNNARHFRIEEDLEVVVTHFYEICGNATSWYSPFPVGNLQLILGAIADLHKEKGYVHGDIRLFNFLLHVGKVVDFDHARRVGSFYANTLQTLAVDGKRAKAVEEAIDGGTLSETEMKFDHDWESMEYALEKLQPTEDATPEFCAWWKSRVKVTDIDSAFRLQEGLGEFASCRLECGPSIKSYLEGI